MERSKFLKLNKADFFKGLLIAVLTAAVTGLYQIIESGGSFDWPTLKPVAVATLGALISYLFKNLFSNSAGETFKSEAA